ncbi:MAG: VOC family protein [Roseitalea sp.]|jgi:hypothetical protein|nr:VOC family protein [Roseitalea sp.]MBO6720396.1 VOC family protein [Roseitalea sp.]MBO6742756.1 VOC family protein [Roseitalea sp.]
MSDRIHAIDHVMIHVPASQTAGATFERLGFAVTPKSGMPGLSNRLICFGDTPHENGICNYLELMALEDAQTAPPPMPRLLDGYGPASTVMAVDDAQAVTERLQQGGMAIGPVLDLRRDWALPDGTVITPAFSVAIPDLGQAPVYWNYCRHKTAHHYVRREFVTHPNTALAFDAVYAIVDDPDAAAAHYARTWQARVDGDRLVLPEGPSMHLMTAQTARATLPDGLVETGMPGLKGLRVRVDDLAKARAVIDNGGVSTIDMPDGFAVRAADAEGCALVFGEQNAADR